MIFRRSFLCLLLIIVGVTSTYSQDIHIAQNYMFPMLIHSTAAGDLQKGETEFGALYRDQGFTITPKSYRTTFAYINGRLNKGFSTNDNIGIGLIALNDRTGSGRLTSNKLSFNLAYHLSFNEEKQKLSFGSQMAYISRFVGDWGAFNFEEELNGGSYVESNDYRKNNYFDIGGGISYYSVFGNDSYLRIGASFGHLNQTNKSNEFIIQSYQRLIAGYLSYDFPIGSKTRIIPEIRYMNSSDFEELSIQSLLTHALSNVTLKFGMGWRYGDAIQLLFGMDFNNYELGIAYEKHTSDLATVSGWTSGLELGIKYKIFKKEKKEELPFNPEMIEPIKSFEINLVVIVKFEEPLDSISIQIEKDTLIQKLMSTKSEFNTKLNKYAPYTINISKEGFESVEIKDSTYEINKDTTIYKEITLKRIVTTPVSNPIIDAPIEEGKTIVLENILYEFDRDEIRPKAVENLMHLYDLMTEYKNMVIELSSHTDVRGTFEYNINLSQRRAESATRWLVDRGIEPKRIIAKGYGEFQLINKCSNGVKCTEEEHLQNRRTEFKVLTIGEK